MDETKRFGGVIKWRMHIPVDRARVFSALTTDEGRASFWAESAVEHEQIIRFQFINGVAYQSKIVERRVPDVFALEYFSSVVRFDLADDGRGGTDLLLTNIGVRTEEWHLVYAGWLNVLFPLKAWLIGAIDLRNHHPKRTWDRGYADQ